MRERSERESSRAPPGDGARGCQLDAPAWRSAAEPHAADVRGRGDVFDDRAGVRGVRRVHRRAPEALRRVPARVLLRGGVSARTLADAQGVLPASCSR